MNAESLRASILHEAVQGRLVPQLDTEPVVEQIGEAPEEVPFVIPEKWKWIQMKELIELVSGRDLEKSQIDNTPSKVSIPYITGASQIDEGEIIVNRWTSMGCVFSLMDDLLLTCKGTVGKLARNCIGKCHIARQIMAIRPKREIEVEFVELVLSAFRSKLISNAKSMIPGISRKDVLLLWCPLPPIEEQHRIVQRLNEILPLVDAYGKEQEELEKLNNEMPGKLRASLLQEAIQGKLVPQLDTEPAVEQIGEEPEEVPFAIPEKWKWCQIGKITTVCSARRVHKADWQSQGVPFYRAREIAKLAEDGFVDNELFISEELYSKLSNGEVVEEGDLMVTAVGTLGKTYVVKREDRFYYKDASVIRIKKCDHVDPNFAKIVLSSPFMRMQIANSSAGTTVGTITIKGAMDFWIPIPPIKEQCRIVRRLNELLKEVDNIKN